MNRMRSLRLITLALAAAVMAWQGAALLGKRPPVLSRKAGDQPGRQSGYPALTLVKSIQSTWYKAGPYRIFTRCVLPQQDTVALPIVLVHGFGVSGRYFISFAKRLAVDHAVYIPDLPGHGRSATPDRALDISGLAKALLDWLGAVGLRRCVLIGQSMGAQIVVEAAKREPHRIAGLVLIGPTSDPHAGLATHLWRLLRVARYERLSLFGILAIDYLRMGLRLIPECRAMLNDPIAEKLEQLDLPVLLMKGARDAIVPDEWFETLRRSARTPYVLVIAGEGHAVQHGAPDSTALTLRPYLGKVSVIEREEKEARRELSSRTEK